MQDDQDILRNPVDDASAWLGGDMRTSTSWRHSLTPRYIEEIDRAIEELRRKRHSLDTVSRADFSFPTFGVFLRRFLWRDVAERGFGVIRGLPRDRYSDDELGMLFWGIGTHLGIGVSQNARGDRLGHVRSEGLDYDALNVRGYQTSAHLPFHCDPSDVVGLMCLRRSKEGGLSSLVSGTALYNAVLREHPEHLPLLYRGFAYDRRGEETHFQQPVSEPVPVFRHVDGELSIRYVRKSIETAREKLGQPFTQEELDALDFLDSVAAREEYPLDMLLEEGDMQFVNNYTILHSRTGYVDHEEPELRRHMLRLWLKIPGFRKLDAALVEYDEASGWSRREGILPPNAPPPNSNPDPLFI